MAGATAPTTTPTAPRFEPAAIETLDDGQALQTLLRLRGVGRWTGEYALLRGLGRLHVFPGDDVGARNNLARWLDCREPLDYARVQAAVRHWQPFAGLVYFHLLLANLAAFVLLWIVRAVTGTLPY